MCSMSTSMALIDPYFNGSMAHRSRDEASMEKKSELVSILPSASFHALGIT